MTDYRPEVNDALNALYGRTNQGEWILLMRHAERLAGLADRLHQWAEVPVHPTDFRQVAKAVTDLIATRRLNLSATAVLVANIDDHDVRFTLEIMPEEIRLHFEGLPHEEAEQGRHVNPDIHVRLTSEGSFTPHNLLRWLDRAEESDRNGGAMLELLRVSLPDRG